ncbi:hypothetical protein C1A50_1372 [Paenibacillus polymyxa]|nr:hypothetical protein C1A50_1372 [Paenibacillus polymyxa]
MSKALNFAVAKAGEPTSIYGFASRVSHGVNFPAKCRK